METGQGSGKETRKSDGSVKCTTSAQRPTEGCSGVASTE
nr:MAG TPA: hypothetical protein [Bacteriophage sp.]